MMNGAGEINAGNSPVMSCWQARALLASRMAARTPQCAAVVPCLSCMRHVSLRVCLLRFMAGLLQGGGPRAVPPPSQSMWAKVNEFVFGL